MLEDELIGGVEAFVYKDGGDESLKTICQNVGVLATFASFFAF